MNNYANIQDNLEEMERFLDACMIPRLSQQNDHWLNQWTIISQQTKIQDHQLNFIKHLRINQSFSNSFKKTEEEGTLSKWFYKASIALISKWDKNFPGGPVVKNLPANAGDSSPISGLGRSHMLQSN